MTWVYETLYEGWRQSFRVKKSLARERSLYQQIEIFESWSHGRVMMLDGAVQVTERDEFIYHEMIVHVPLMQHGRASRVLVIGAGDGGVLRHVLQHGTVAKVVMVEIDEAVVRLSQEHLPGIAASAWNDPRAEVIIGDGIAFVANAQASAFDVIIVDSTDPAGPGESLFTEDFYQQCARVLTPGGILVNQSGVPFLQSAELAWSSRHRTAAFSHVGLYVVAVPTYIGGLMALGLSSDTARFHLSDAELTTRATTAGIIGKTRYWTPGTHNASFAIPPYLAV